MWAMFTDKHELTASIEIGAVAHYLIFLGNA